MPSSVLSIFVSLKISRVVFLSLYFFLKWGNCFIFFFLLGGKLWRNGEFYWTQTVFIAAHLNEMDLSLWWKIGFWRFWENYGRKSNEFSISNYLKIRKKRVWYSTSQNRVNLHQIFNLIWENKFSFFHAKYFICFKVFLHNFLHK